MDLVQVMGQATMKAYVMHGRDREIDASKACVDLRRVMKAGWGEFHQTLKDATEANMGDVTYKAIMNTFANAWAVEALNS